MPAPAETHTSCERCKRRKSKCDRRLPSCQRCLEAQVRCEYQTRRRPGFATGHRQVLESRIRALEAEVNSLRAPGSTERDVSEPGPTPIDDPNNGHPASTADFQSTDRSHDRSTSNMAGSSARPKQQLMHPADPVFQATYSRTSSVVEKKPPKDLVISSVSTYFRHIHPWLPFLDVQRVFNDLGNTRDLSLLHYAIFGASLPFLFDSRLDQASSDSFWKFTKRRILNETVEEPSYSSLEAATILTLDLSGMTNGPQVWSRLAVITKLASQLRTEGTLALRSSVQDNIAQGAPASKPSSQQHGRLFWAIYALDSFISITTSQPSSITNHDLQHFVPSRDITWIEQSLDSSADGFSTTRKSLCWSATDVFLQQLTLLDIARQAHSIYLDLSTTAQEDITQMSRWLDSVHQCSATLQSWMSTSPAGVGATENQTNESRQNTGANSPTKVALDAYSHAISIYLHSLVAFTPYDASLQALFSTVIEESRATSLHAVKTIADICTSHVDEFGDQLGWPFTWALWTAARLQLTAAFHNHEDLPGSFHALMASLYKMGKFWQISKKYWWLLRQAETALGVHRATDQRDDPSILTWICDPRIPTSHLEDQFRVDPVLSRLDNARPKLSSTSRLVSAPQDTGSADPSMMTLELPHDFFSNTTGNNSMDTWFTMPLSATSAYQQSWDGTSGSSMWDPSWPQ